MRKALIAVSFLTILAPNREAYACTGAYARITSVDAIAPTQADPKAKININYQFGTDAGPIQGSFRTYRNGVTWDSQQLRTGNGSATLLDFVPSCTLMTGTATYRVVPSIPACPDAAITEATSNTITWDAYPKVNNLTASIDETTYEVVASVGYEFPFWDGHDHRQIEVFLDGVVREFEYLVGPTWPAQGTFSTRFPLGCLARGNHTVEARTKNCQDDGYRYSETISWPLYVEPVKITDLDLSAPDQSGIVTATVGYDFLVAGADFRDVELFKDGTRIGWRDVLTENPGTTTPFTFTVPCSGTVSYEIKARGTACEQWSDLAFRHEQITQLAIPTKKGELSGMSALYVPPAVVPGAGTVKITGQYTLPPGLTSAVIVITSEATVGDMGTPTSAVEKAQITVGPATTGTYTTSFVAPETESPVNLKLTAKMESCGGVADDSATVECGCNDKSTKPVFYTDGNMEYSDSDPLPPLLAQPSLARAYDSNHQTRGAFGRGWRSALDSRIFARTSSDGVTLSLTSPSGRSAIFTRRNGIYTQLSPKGENGTGELRFETTTDSYVYRPAGQFIAELYQRAAEGGRFLGYREIGTGHESRVAYSADGLPVSVTDSWTGLTWNITTDSAKRRVTAIEAAGLVWQYLYDTNDNLAEVRAPGNGIWRVYEYANNRMTAARDVLGNLIESHTFDASGRAIDSTGSNEDIQSIEYNAPGSTATRLVTRVTQKSGASTDHILEATGGAWRTVQVIGGCSSCSTHDTTYVYDKAGHVIREQHASGYVTLSTYADGRLTSVETALRPSGCDPETSSNRCRLDSISLATAAFDTTAATLATTYEYTDSTWPDRITARSMASVLGSGQSRRESFTYHALTGETITTTANGFTAGSNGEPVSQDRVTNVALYGDDANFEPAFDPEGTFNSAWLALPQPAYLRKSVDGPRTDAIDVAQFVYYPVNTAVPANLRGRLAAVRSPLGHITRYEAYDVFGNPTRVVDPNGVATEATYDALGRMLTSTVKGEPGCSTSDDPLCATDLTTTRTYSPASGPLVSEMPPGGGVTTYAYDTRGRVSAVSRGSSSADLRERMEIQYDPLSDNKSLERLLAYEVSEWVEKKRESYTYNSLGQLEIVTSYVDSGTTVRLPTPTTPQAESRRYATKITHRPIPGTRTIPKEDSRRSRRHLWVRPMV